MQCPSSHTTALCIAIANPAQETIQRLRSTERKINKQFLFCMQLYGWQGQHLPTHSRLWGGLLWVKGSGWTDLNENKDKWGAREDRADRCGVQRVIFHRHLIWVQPGTFASGLVGGGAIILLTDWQQGMFFRLQSKSWISWLWICPMAASSFPVWKIANRESDEMQLQRVEKPSRVSAWSTMTAIYHFFLPCLLFCSQSIAT